MNKFVEMSTFVSVVESQLCWRGGKTGDIKIGDQPARQDAGETA